MLEKLLKKKEEKPKTIRDFILELKRETGYILDEENAIILIKNDDRSIHDESYIMIHKRLIDGKLVEINRWYMRSYYFGGIERVSVIDELNLFKVQNGWGRFNSLYDYKNGKFVVPQGDWGLLEFDYNKKYNGVIASFSLRSDYEEDDSYSYINQVTGEKMHRTFTVQDFNYYAVLNFDGTIRGNKLFRGENLSRITGIIDLNEYESLKDFKQKRKQELNEEKKARKEKYYKQLEETGKDYISPYLDEEVLKVLKLGQKQN